MKIKDLFSKYAFVVFAIVWTEIDYAVILRYCTTFKNFLTIGGLSLIVEICLIVWGIVYAIKCRKRILKNYWSIFQNKWVYGVTVILFVLYLLLSYIGALGYALIQLDVYQLFAEHRYAAFMAGYGNIFFAVCAAMRYVIVFCFILWVVVSSVVQYYTAKYICSKQQAENLALQKEIETAHAQNNQYKSYLQSCLKDRVALTLALREKALILQDKSLLSLPNAIITETQWDEFLTAYNMCHDEILSRLHYEHPQLTDTDMLYLVLCVLDMSPHDISLLLDSTDRTVWNRRQLVKEHLNQDVTNLNEWIENLG